MQRSSCECKNHIHGIGKLCLAFTFMCDPNYSHSDTLSPTLKACCGNHPDSSSRTLKDLIPPITILHGGTFITIFLTCISRSKNTRSKSNFMKKVWTLLQGKRHNARPSPSEERPRSPLILCPSRTASSTLSINTLSFFFSTAIFICPWLNEQSRRCSRYFIISGVF